MYSLESNSYDQGARESPQHRDIMSVIAGKVSIAGVGDHGITEKS